MRLPITIVALAACSLLAGCGDSEPGDDPSAGDQPDGDSLLVFGESTEPCAPIVLSNDTADDAAVRDGAACFLAAIEVGDPVTWDVRSVTVEGDTIPIRYAFDGESTVITTDTTRDQFGSDEVVTQQCTGVEPTAWLPEGVGCTEIDGPGFADDSLP